MSRNSGREIENAALMLKIIEFNQYFAEAKYWEDSVWVGIYWSKEIAELDYLH